MSINGNLTNGNLTQNEIDELVKLVKQSMKNQKKERRLNLWNNIIKLSGSAAMFLNLKH